MKLKIYQIDAFAEKVFSGNPAAVIPLENWVPDEVMQKIAMENNLSETAFLFQLKMVFISAGLLRLQKSICADMQHWQQHMYFSTI